MGGGQQALQDLTDGAAALEGTSSNADIVSVEGAEEAPSE
jgi:hypothetical protein